MHAAQHIEIKKQEHSHRNEQQQRTTTKQARRFTSSRTHKPGLFAVFKVFGAVVLHKELVFFQQQQAEPFNSAKHFFPMYSIYIMIFFMSVRETRNIHFMNHSFFSFVFVRCRVQCSVHMRNTPNELCTGFTSSLSDADRANDNARRESA